MGSGVAMLDFNNDGLLDLFFVNGAALRDPMPPGAKPDKSDPRFWNRLYRNNGDGTFTDVTEKSGLRGEGYGMGVAVGDFDNSGLPGLYVTSFGTKHPCIAITATAPSRTSPRKRALPGPAGPSAHASSITIATDISI